MTGTDENVLIEAIGHKRARAVATELVEQGSRLESLAQEVLDSCDAIASRVNTEIARLQQHPRLRSAQLTADPSGQLYRITGQLSSPAEAAAVVTWLRSEGYVTWHDLSGDAEAAFYRANTQVTVAHLDDAPLVLELSWPAGPFQKLPTFIRPSLADFAAIGVPGPLWPLYGIVRPVRLLAERLGVREPRSRALGPILSTPRAIISSLLTFAEVGPEDHLVDMGCGEGRVVVEAARTIGCQVTGVETDIRLVERARRNIREELTEDANATIVHGDARTFDLSDATVVFLFIPASAVAGVVADIRAGGFDGRIVSHEQEHFPSSAQPKESRILVADGALTVAHLW